MTFDQLTTLLVLAVVVAALIRDRLRADVVALAGAAFLLVTGIVRPVEVEKAFASPAIITLASLFVIAYAMELSGLLDAAIKKMVGLCRRIGTAGLWILVGLAGPPPPFSTIRRSSFCRRRSCAMPRSRSAARPSAT